jgi:hypothetical protein
MSASIPEATDESTARAAPRGGVCRQPAMVGRGEAHARQSRPGSRGGGGTTHGKPGSQGRGERARLGRTHSRSSAGRAAVGPGQGRATARDGARA